MREIRYYEALIEAMHEEMDRDIEAICEEAVRFAEESPDPPLSALYEDVYAEHYPSDPHA